jgi:hypothetical protein
MPWFDPLAMPDDQGWRACLSVSSARLAAYWGKEPNENNVQAPCAAFLAADPMPGSSDHHELQVQHLVADLYRAEFRFPPI